MSILLYCVTTESASADVGPGVAGLPVLRRRETGLDALFSHTTSAENWTGASLKQSAREFHSVLQRAFAAHAIIPFRFPTVIDGEDELVTHLRQNAAEYSARLKEFENSVQMDISIALLEPHSARSQTSGAEYLRTRQKRSVDLATVAEQIQKLAGETAQEWRDRPLSNIRRLFALVHRDSVESFRERLKKLSVPQNLNVRVSGPWPACEFLELKQR